MFDRAVKTEFKRQKVVPIRDEAQELRERIAGLIDADKELILDQYFDKLREYLRSGRKSQSIPEWLIMLLRARFADVLERQVSYLRTGQYDNSASSEDKNYAIQVVPFCSQNLKSRRLILTMELFVGTVTEHIFRKLKDIEPLAYTQMAPLLDKLAFLAYEDLWITTIVSHRFQRDIIQKLLKNTIKAHENERRELAMVLHDGVLQSLAAALVQTQIMEKLIKKTNRNRELLQELLRLQETITETVRKTRDINYELYPLCLREQGLIATLEGYLSGMKRETGMSVEMAFPESIDEKRWGKDTQASIYRMIHELMTNVKKHANADRVKIEINTVDDCLRLTVEDDGIGFDLPGMLGNLTTSAAFGLLSVREQTMGHGGVMKIQTCPGQGTRIEIEIPRDDKKV